MKKLKQPKTWWGIIGLSFLLLLSGGEGLLAQPRMRDRPFAGQSRRLERFETFMKLKLVEALDLSPEQGDKFLPVFNQYRQKTRQLLRARAEIIQALTRHVHVKMAALDEEEEGGLSERELKERLAKLDELRRRQEANREEFYHNVGRTLSTEQVARLVVFEERIAREIVRNLPNP
ncbi:MAG: hypothetical protein L0196_09660 [candidate division Zixibacteria bacterium]|nr:hypothetical protein [candidate division Zixibacteria bacterium]